MRDSDSSDWATERVKSRLEKQNFYFSSPYWEQMNPNMETCLSEPL